MLPIEEKKDSYTDLFASTSHITIPLIKIEPSNMEGVQGQTRDAHSNVTEKDTNRIIYFNTKKMASNIFV